MLVKNKTYFINTLAGSPGLSYGNETLASLVGKDSDGDGVEDEEEIRGLRAAADLPETEESATNEEESLTQTDKLSRELFSAVVALNQVGEVDAAAAEKLTESIAEQIKNSVPKKIYLASEINVTNDNSREAMERYVTDISNIYKKYPTPSKTTLDVLVEFVGDGETENPEALKDLEPIAAQTKNVIDEMIKMSVPGDLSSLHLEVVNGLQRLKENIEDIGLFEFDPIVAMGGISKYEENTFLL